MNGELKLPILCGLEIIMKSPFLLVCEKKAVYIAVKNNKIEARNTRPVERSRE